MTKLKLLNKKLWQLKLPKWRLRKCKEDMPRRKNEPLVSLFSSKLAMNSSKTRPGKKEFLMLSLRKRKEE